MKGTAQARLMKVFEIETNYQKHRQRLMSIQHINTRKKQSITSIKPSDASITYKQNRLKADVFAYKTKVDHIHHENQLLLQKIEQQCNKNRPQRGRSISRHSSRHSLTSSQSARSIDFENKRIYTKLNSVKSNYSKFRDQNHKNTAKGDSRNQLLNLLVHQLGVKPSVLFPKVIASHTKQKSSSKISRNSSQASNKKKLKLQFDSLPNSKHNLSSAPPRPPHSKF